MRQKLTTYTDDPDYKIEKIANLDHFPHVKGYDFNKKFNFKEFMESYYTTEDGIVHALYGSQNGLTTQRNQIWSQTDSSDATPDPNDRFGNSLSSGDFNGDGRDDLAIGVTGETVSGADYAGVVHIFYGTIRSLLS